MIKGAPENNSVTELIYGNMYKNMWRDISRYVEPTLKWVVAQKIWERIPSNIKSQIEWRLMNGV